jgi:enterochelin esterase-like enzyme
MLSKRLQRLEADLAAGGSGALEAFWGEVERDGAPLIEPDDERDDARVVTFLWRATEPVQHVALIEWFSDGDFCDKLMAKLEGTDLWYRSYRLRSDLRLDYQFGPNDPLTPKRQETDWETRRAGWRRDPLNPVWYLDAPHPDTELPEERGWSVVTLPDAEPQPWIGEREGTPRGVVTHSRFASRLLGNERDLWLYRPAGGVQPAVLLIQFDGERAMGAMDSPTVFDNLVHAGAIPPLAVVMVGNADRSAELPCNAQFVRMLTDELLPWAQETLGLELLPGQVLVAGQSYGGLAAAFCALERPDVFSGAICQSGSFWWKPDPRNEEGPGPIAGDAPAYGWLPERAANVEWAETRFYLDAGRLENRHFDDAAPSLLQSVRHMRDVLRARGFAVTYREFAGGHDAIWWRSTLADGLVALVGREA